MGMDGGARIIITFRKLQFPGDLLGEGGREFIVTLGRM